MARDMGGDVIDNVTDIITRRADDVVDITPEIAGTDDLGALNNLGTAQPLTPDQQGIAIELGQQNAERIRMETQGPLQEVNPTFQAEPQITINITPEQQAGIDAIRAREAAQDRADAAVNFDDDTMALETGQGETQEVDIEQLLADTPVKAARDATNTEQLRELYAEYKLPIPKTNAEERAANLIIDVDQHPDSVMQSILRKNIDLEYFKAHAPKDVFDKHGPTIFEAKLAEQQQGALSAILPISGPRPDIPFYSAAQRAAESLTVPSGSYKNLKKLMLKQKGVKAKELEWSGADEAFEGRTDVTPAELAEYLRQNTDLIEAETRMAPGVMRGDGGGDEVRQYINDNLADEIEAYKDDFLENWEYNNDMDKISDLNNQTLEEFAEQIDGVSSGRELAEKYPDGYVLKKQGNALVPDGVTLLFADKDTGAEYAWSQAKSSYDNIARESLETRLDNMQQYDPDDYNRAVYGNADPPADPAELQYAEYFPEGATDMRETTYRYRDPTGKLDDDYFSEEHFDQSGRDTNLVAHARTGEFPVEGGGTAYHLGEAQSDMQQGLRKSGKTPRTRDMELLVGKRDELFDNIGNEVRGSENDLNKTLFGNEIGLGTTFRRAQPEYAVKLDNYKKIIASYKNKRLGTQFQPEDIADDHSFFEDAGGSQGNQSLNLDEFAAYIKDNSDRIPDPSYLQWANKHTDTFIPEINNLADELDKFSSIDLRKTDTGAPFVESTDAWLDMVLRRQLADAIESGADYLTLPNPQMVKDYTYGDFEGHRQFYGTIAPKNLMNIVKPADKTAELVPVQINTKKQNEDVLALPLTQSLISGLNARGLPKYVVPFGGVGLGALGSVTEDEETATGGGL